nr:AncNTT_RozMic [synthetic construct]
MTGVSLESIKSSIFNKNPNLPTGSENSAQSNSEFSTWRGRFWPIHGHEYKKLLPLLLMLFLICFNYSVLRDMKDALVIQASGSESIPYIKLWAVLPISVLFTLLFTKLSNRYSQEKVFYIMLSGFLLFFALFGFVLLPFRDYLHPHKSALETILPGGKMAVRGLEFLLGLLVMFRYWTFTLIYVFAELWGSIVLSLLFWGFANEICTINEAKRFYPLLSIGANIALIISGLAMIGLSKLFGSDSWEQTLILLQLALILAGLLGALIFFIYRYMQKNVLSDPLFYEPDLSKPKKKKSKLGIVESFKFLLKSKYLLCIAIIVIAYNLVINLIEVVYKNQIRLYYPSKGEDPLSYLVYTKGIESAITGIAVIILLLSPMSNLIRRFGWTKTALITPIIILVTSLGFFGFLWYKNSLMETGSSFSSFKGLDSRKLPLLILEVFFGFLQVVLSKAFKYSVFDATKEMAFIPLDDESRAKSKAAIDGVGSRLGKSGGSLIHILLLMIFNTNSLSYAAPFVALIILGIILIWIFSTRSLGRQFNELTEEGEELEISEISKKKPKVSELESLKEEKSVSTLE